MRTLTFMRKYLISIGFIAFTLVAHGQGTLMFVNGVTTRVQLWDVQTGVTSTVPTSVSLHFGLFVNGSATPVLPLGTSSTSVAGVFEAPNGSSFPIPGTVPGQSVSVQVRGWAAEFGEDWQAAKAGGGVYGETGMQQVTLTVAPGIPIWQSSGGTSLTRFRPLIVAGGGITVGDLTVAEGSNGVANAVFTVKLAGPLADAVTVDFTTQDGSAIAGQDYVATNGTVTFAPGETSKTVSVTVTADAPAEADEQFDLVLSNPANAAIRKGTAACLITEASILEVRMDIAVVFHTVAGRYYSVERSTDFFTWSIIPGAENVRGQGGPMTVYDKGAGGSGVRLYRTRLLTP